MDVWIQYAFIIQFPDRDPVAFAHQMEPNCYPLSIQFNHKDSYI